jgi:FkbM family methyltransferase
MTSTRDLVRRLVPRTLRNWVRAPRKTAQWMSDAVRHSVGRDRDLQLRPDWRLRCHPAAYRALRAAQLNDPAQVAELNEFVRHCTPGMVLFDLGAHFGLFSLAALHYGGSGARAVAVDPSPTAARMLATQAGLNGVRDRLTVVRAAASERPGALDLLDAGVIADGYFVEPTGARPARELSRVEAVSIDSLVEAVGAAPTHIKVDVEGFEGAVLAGGRTTLGGDPSPVIFLELHNQLVRHAGRDPRRPLELLAQFGYTDLTVDGAPVSSADLLEVPLVRLAARRG